MEPLIFSHSKSRFENFDFIRYITASLVVLIHYLDIYIVPKYGGWETSLGSIVRMVAIFSVLTFFILSGYVIAYSCDNRILNKKFSLTEYLCRRFVRIYSVVWGVFIFTIIVVVIMWLFSLNGLSSKGFYLPGNIGSADNFLGYKHLLYSIFLPPSGYYAGFFNDPLWSISYEIAFYIIYGLLVSSIIKVGVIRVIIALAMLILYIFVWFSITIGVNNSLLYNLVYFITNFPCWNFIPYFIIWLFGVGCFFFTKITVTCRSTIIIAIVLINILLIIVAHHYLNIDFSYNTYKMATIGEELNINILMTTLYSIFLLVLIYLIQFIQLHNKLLFISRMGKNFSYTLYASHFVIMGFLFGLLYNLLLISNIIIDAVLFIFVFIICNVIAYFLSKVLENTSLWTKVVLKIIKSN